MTTQEELMSEPEPCSAGFYCHRRLPSGVCVVPEKGEWTLQRCGVEGCPFILCALTFEPTSAEADEAVRMAARDGCTGSDRPKRGRGRGYRREEVAPAPVQPVEPRRFRVGDRVRLNFGSECAGVIVHLANDDVVVVRWDHNGSDAYVCAVHLTDVTPVQQDGEAAPAVRFHECSSCGYEYATPDGCEGCKSAYAYDPPKPKPYVHEGATLTNPAGFPVMPEPIAGTVIIADTSPHAVDMWKSKPASVVLPFDAWLAARERSEPEPYDPQEGDEVEVHVGDAPNYTGVFARFSEDGDLVVRYRDHDGHERSVSVHPYCVTLVRRPGGA